MGVVTNISSWRTFAGIIVIPYMAIIMTHMAYTHRIDLKLRESIMPLAMFVNTNSKIAVDVGSLI